MFKKIHINDEVHNVSDDEKKEMQQLHEDILHIIDGHRAGSIVNVMTNLITHLAICYEIDRDDFLEKMTELWDNHYKDYRDQNDEE